MVLLLLGLLAAFVRAKPDEGRQGVLDDRPRN
jgi:hypothetical protein